MTDSVEAFLRRNTFSGTFQPCGQAPGALDVHRIVFNLLGLRVDEVRCVQLEMGISKFFVKVNTEARFREVLARRSVEYQFQTGPKTKVDLSDAGQGVVNVRVFRLPVEVDNSVVRAALSQYGKILDVYEEKWAKYEGFGVSNGVRGVKIEMKEGVNIPSYMKIKGVEVVIHYPGQTQTCRKCHQTGHMLYLCPMRAINKEGGRRWETFRAANNINVEAQPAQPVQPKPTPQAKPADDAGQDSGEEGSSEPDSEEAGGSWQQADSRGKGRRRGKRKGGKGEAVDQPAEAANSKPNEAQAPVTKQISAATPPHATADAAPLDPAVGPATTPSHAAPTAASKQTNEEPDADVEAVVDDIVEYLRSEDHRVDKNDVRKQVQAGADFDTYLQIFQDRLLQSQVAVVPPDPQYPKRKEISDSDPEEHPITQRLKS